MTLLDAITATGMTPPQDIALGRWLRFPGIGKGRSNRAGWCRMITPTMAIFGDWSSNVSHVWRDENHRDDATSARLLAEARQREREFHRQQRDRQQQAAITATAMIRDARLCTHPYLRAKGFPDQVGLVHDDKLIVPMRDARDYDRVLSVQQITADGDKRFLAAGRTRGAIYRLRHPRSRQVVLCEGYATGLSLDAALKRLSGSYSVVVCFSAFNLVLVAEAFPYAAVCADNDESRTGEDAARKTGLRWCMPERAGDDFNDLHQRSGVLAVMEALRPML